MPQDIPVEASEVLAFTPPSLAEKDPAPVFILRAVTSRDKRFQARLYRENGFRIHGKAEMRAEVIAALKSGNLWTDEQASQHVPVIQTLWEAQDDFELARKDDTDLEWSYDAEVEAAVSELVERVTDAWAPLRRMIADNAEMAQIMVPVMVAVVVKSWTGIDHKRDLDRGYLTLDCAVDLVDKLEAIDPAAVAELFVAAAGRMRLSEDEQKNSESPSPSGIAQKPSTETKASDEDGASPAPASSQKTPEAA